MTTTTLKYVFCDLNRRKFKPFKNIIQNRKSEKFPLVIYSHF